MPEQKEGEVDVIVVGGGVNGLVAAAYLAKSGRKTLLFEKKRILGGIAVTEEFFPGYRFSSLVDGAGYLLPQVASDLELARHGLNVVPVDPVIYSLQPEGPHLAISRDVRVTSQEIAGFSRADAASYPEFVETLRKLSAVLQGIMAMTPPDLPAPGLKDLLKLWPLLKPLRNVGREGLAQLLRILPLPVADLLDEWFESDVVKGAIAASALINCSWGPQEGGTAYHLLYNWASSNNGLFRSSGNIAGGMGALSRALAEAARASGAQIHVNAPVARIMVEDGSARGVELRNGEQYRAGAVVSATNMNTTFLQLAGTSTLAETFVDKLEKIKYRGTSARVHFVLRELPRFRGVYDNAHDLLSAHIQIAPTPTYLQKAFDPVKYGRYAEAPYLDLFIPTLTDPSLRSDNAHIMSVTAKYVPYRLREGDWDSLRDELAGLVIRQLEAYAPGFADLITHCKVITPLDLERDYDLPEGSYTHGEMTLDQFMWMRPVSGYGQYRSPIKNLYLCGAATHPGGGVTGINGKNAAAEILRGRRIL